MSMKEGSMHASLQLVQEVQGPCVAQMSEQAQEVRYKGCTQADIC